MREEVEPRPQAAPAVAGAGTGPEPGAIPATGSSTAATTDWRSRLHVPHVRREVRWTATTVVLIFVFEYVLLPEIATARRSVKLLGQVNVLWLVLAVLLEGLALVSYAELTRTVLSPGAPTRGRLFRINMSSLAASHVLPGGTAPGTAVAYRLLLEADVPGSVAGFGLATQGVGSAVVLNALFWLALIVSIPLNGYNPLYGIAAALGVLMLAAFAGTVILLTRGKAGAAERLHRVAEHVPLVNPDSVSAVVQKVADRLQVLLRDRRLLINALVWAAANWLFDAASLWVFLFAFGKAVFPVDLLVAYGLANILAAIPITPGGLGVVEVTLTATLVGFGVPRSIAGVGVLAWRLVNFWLPIPVGGVCYGTLRFGPEGRRARARRLAGRSGNGPAVG